MVVTCPSKSKSSENINDVILMPSSNNATRATDSQQSIDIQKPQDAQKKSKVLMISLSCIVPVLLIFALGILYFIPDFYATLFNACQAGTYNAGTFTSCKGCSAGTFSIY